MTELRTTKLIQRFSYSEQEFGEEGRGSHVKLFWYRLYFCCCLTLTQSSHADSQTVWENAVWLLQLTSFEALIAKAFPESDANTVSSPHYCSSSAVDRQSVSPGNFRLSVKWMLNYFRLVKCSSLFFPVFFNLVVQVQDVFKDVCTCFLSCYFFVFLSSHCIICYLNTKYYSRIKKG